MDSGHRRGSAELRRVSFGMCIAGFSVFLGLYAVQPLLPEFAGTFEVSAAEASLVLALPSAGLGLALLPAVWLSDAWGRTRVMAIALLLAAVLAVASALAADFTSLLIARTLQGVALAGVPAVGMAYLAEEVHPSAHAGAVGLFVGGNALGGMTGRLVAGAVDDYGDWRMALLVVAALSLVCALPFSRLIPASQRQPRSSFEVRAVGRSLAAQVRDGGQLRLNLVGALLMGTFVVTFNAVGFRLTAAPYGLSSAAIAALFLIYPLGSLAAAGAGRLAELVGRARVLPVGICLAGSGIAITCLHGVVVIVVGMAILTAGYFAAHSVASSWVGRHASGNPAQASALYLLALYTGSAAGGPLGGFAWHAAQWTGVAILTGAMLLMALIAALQLGRPEAERRAGTWVAVTNWLAGSSPDASRPR